MPTTTRTTIPGKIEDAVSRVSDKADSDFQMYANGEDRPLKGYTAALGVFGGLVGALGLAGRLTHKRLPDGISLVDFALMSLATHKLSRILTKDAITSPLRAPFTKYKEPAGAGELNEEVRSSSESQHVAGELLGCPFCLAVWVASGLVAGNVFAPRQTRAITTTFSLVAVSDALQFLYSGLKKLD